jgi:hypothetical protein
VQPHRAISTTTPTKTLTEILQFVPLEDAEEISEFQGLVSMSEGCLVRATPEPSRSKPH